MSPWIGKFLDPLGILASDKLKSSTVAFFNQLRSVDKGLLPLLLSGLASFILFVFFILLFLKVPQTSHIVLSFFPKRDPALPTLLIIFYSAITIYIFRKELIDYIERHPERYHEIQQSSKLIGLSNLILFAPIACWLGFLLYYIITQWDGGAQSHKLFSVAISLLGIYLLAFFNIQFVVTPAEIGDTNDDVEKSTENDSQELEKESDEDSIKSGINRLNLTLFTTVFKEKSIRLNRSIKFLSYSLLYIFIIYFLLYEIRYFHELNDLVRDFIRADTAETGLLISMATLLLFLLFILLSTIKLNIAANNIQNGKILFGLQAIIFILLSLTIFISSIRPLEIVILWFICLRVGIYYINSRLLIALELFFNDDRKSILKKLKKRDGIGTLLVLYFIVFCVPGFFRASDQENNSIQTQVHNFSEKYKYHSVDSQFVNFIQNQPGRMESDTITAYLIAGQGGGSRAGATIFSFLSMLDPAIQDNIFAISTVSGSSSGAGYYLSLKEYLRQEKNSTCIPIGRSDINNKMLKTLYQHDLISVSLFKLLFTDWVPFIRKHFDDNRNHSLKWEEKNRLVEAFSEIEDLMTIDSSCGFVFNEMCKMIHFEEPVKYSEFVSILEHLYEKDSSLSNICVIDYLLNLLQRNTLPKENLLVNVPKYQKIESLVNDYIFNESYKLNNGKISQVNDSKLGGIFRGSIFKNDKKHCQQNSDSSKDKQERENASENLWTSFKSIFRVNMDSAASKKAYNSFLTKKIDDIYSDSVWMTPLFLPLSYNISRGIRAHISPIYFSRDSINPVFPLYRNNKEGVCFTSLNVHDAILLSQTFPIINASESINQERYLDGGIYDNFAFKTTQDIYESLTQYRNENSQKVRIVILSIENKPPSCTVPQYSNCNCMKNRPTFKHKNELFTTAEAINKAVFKSTACENYWDLLTSVNKYGEGLDTIIRVYPQNGFLPDEKEVVMSRYLNEDDINSIHNSSKYNSEKINQTFIKYHRKADTGIQVED